MLTREQVRTRIGLYPSYVSGQQDREVGESVCWVPESAVLEVTLPGDTRDSCGPARELAAEVWAKLPW